MISIDFEVLTLVYLLMGGLLIFGLWIYYDRRDRAAYALQRKESTFHCVRCGHLYTALDRKVVPCPKCQFENSILRF